MSLFKSIGGIAKSITGSVGDFRGILNANPGAIGFLLPPQVQIGIAAATKASQVLGLGLKIPSIDQIAKAEKTVTGILGSLSPSRGTITKEGLDAILKGGFTKTFPEAPNFDPSNPLGSVKTALQGLGLDEVINSIDWLI